MQKAVKFDWKGEVSARTELLQKVKALRAEVEKSAGLLEKAVLGGHKVLVFGNGGSAADAQHFAAELVGRYKRERRGTPAMALTSDPSIVSALANDYGFENLFARQVAAYGAAGDVAVALSTSGRSRNVVNGAEEAKARGLAVIALTGMKRTPLAAMADVCIRVPSGDTALIQEVHMMILHTFARLMEEALI